MQKHIARLAALVVAALVISMSPARAHDAGKLNPPPPQPVCGDAAPAPDNHGDDVCDLPAGSFTDLTGQMYADVNVLFNDDSPESPAICDYVDDENGVALDPAIGVLAYQYYRDTSGEYIRSLGIWIETTVTEDFQFQYIGCDDVVRTVTVHPTPYDAPDESEVLKPPSVTKAKEHGKTLKGFLRICVPPTDPALLLVMGTYNNPDGPGLYDGYTVVKPGKKHCKLYQVHRTKINWEAYEYQGDRSAGTGTVRGIKLPKGDHLPRQSARISADAPFGGHWGFARFTS